MRREPGRGRGEEQLFRKLKDSVCLVNLPRRPSTLREGPCLPLGLLQLAASLERTSVRASILDFDLEAFEPGPASGQDFLERAAARIVRTRSRFVGLAAASATLPLAVLLAGQIKAARSDSVVILGGPGAYAVEREILEEFPDIDVVVSGEGESTLPELIRVLASGQGPGSVAGVFFRKDGLVVKTAERRLVENLDDLPIPSFETVRLSRYLRSFRRAGISPYLPIEVGRGCPKLCAFCSTSRFWGGRARQKSVGRILDEMARASRSGIADFLLLHDNAGARPGFLAGLCESLIRTGAPYHWSCAVSADRVDPGEIGLLGQAGCSTVLIGIESASPRMQRLIGKHLDLDKADWTIRQCLRTGLQVQVTFILGFPDEEMDDLTLSLERILEYHRSGADVHIQFLELLPGTPLWERYRPKSVLSPLSDQVNPRWIKTVEEERLVFDHPRVFSSFRVPGPEDRVSEDAQGASLFYGTLFQTYTQPLCEILEAVRVVGDGFPDVYRSWADWAETRLAGVPRSPDVVAASFNDFLDDFSQDFYRRLEMIKRTSPS